MRNPSACSPDNYLLLHISDCVHLTLRRQCGFLPASCSLPACPSLLRADLCGPAVLRGTQFSPHKGGFRLCAVLELPVQLRIGDDCCRPICLNGCLSTDISLLLRTNCVPSQLFPQVEICVYDLKTGCGGLHIWYDVTLTLYAACLQPTCLPGGIDVCTPPCGLPIYPQLPAPCASAGRDMNPPIPVQRTYHTYNM